MSGGHFYYLQNRLNDIIEQLESDIKFNDVPPNEASLDEPSGPQFGEQGLRGMRALLSLCQNAKALLDAYDLAVSCDTSEDAFVEDAQKVLARVANDCTEFAKDNSAAHGG